MSYWVIIVWGLNPLTSHIQDQFMDEWKFKTYRECNEYVDKNYKDKRGPDGDELIFICREYKK